MNEKCLKVNMASRNDVSFDSFKIHFNTNNFKLFIDV